MTTDTIADAIQMEVFSNRLLAIAEDMGSILIRSSFSSNIKERRDCSTALFDANGRLITQADHIPIHLGAMIGAVEAMLKRYPLAAMQSGDAYIANDPYLAGGSHLPDISIITPVHQDGEVRFFCGNIAHHADVGGKTPGSTSGTSRSIFEEGIRLPIIRIARAGEIDEDLLELIAHNTRDPEERLLDLRTQIGTNVRGGTMLVKLIERMGWPAVEQAVEDILTYTRRRLRNRVAALPDGVYRFERSMDDDGFPGEPVPIVCTATIAGDTLSFDFEGSGPQARGAINLPDSALKASIYYCVKAVLDPGLMPNQGIIDPIVINAPAGTIVNPNAPAAVAGRAVTSNRLCGAVFGALYQAMPAERVMASCNDSTSAVSVSGWHSGRNATYVYPESMGGGAGAFSDRDGMDAIHVHTVNSTNLPAEALELEYPLLLEEYCLVPDSGGAGRHRGGMGMARQIRVRDDNTTFSARSDAHIIPAPGVQGGKSSNVTRILRNPGTDGEEALHSKASGLTLMAGEIIRVETLGGGGFGDPAERSLDALAQDLRQEKVTRPAAERDYGVARVAAALDRPEGAQP
ncbi:hydantoinase B/oxoprolinase family protein [Devosia psychrophila]|uniref:5-oxoprolinase n=1 Tax=Devosia psychrophila TaxID=728005 RepID=A0A0F5PY04_9HYPH|nr:hydantoinase B/oxoprolinase family protein [Devosia psychrophila]KKC33510.1 5-oxoprolinase [Devosia psychrophila]SFD15671.1 N-methylhydantoinase B [Devosia psychrophila]